MSARSAERCSSLAVIDLALRGAPGTLCRIPYTSSMAKMVPFTEARARLTELLDEVNERHEHVVITRNGRPAGVVLSSDEYEALAETLEVLEDDEAIAALRESEADVRAGRVYSLDEVRRELGLA